MPGVSDQLPETDATEPSCIPPYMKRPRPQILFIIGLEETVSTDPSMLQDAPGNKTLQRLADILR